MNPENPELSSWKAIGLYLQVSPRTAQLWEKESGLPVHRLPGRNSVFAYARELDTWKRGQPASGPAVAPPAPAAAAAGRRLWPWAAVAVGAVLTVAGVLATQSSSGAGGGGGPFRVQPDPVGFSVLDRAGRLLWRKSFDEGLRLGMTTLGDVDGDGTMEVLVTPQPTDGEPGEPKSVPLICYSAGGEELWRFLPGGKPEYWGHSVLVPPFQESPAIRVILGSHHRLNYPFQVAFLDGRGKLAGEFWHAGHLPVMSWVDLDGDGRPELLLGGVSNARQSATLLAIDPFGTRGAAPERHAQAHPLPGHPLAGALQRVCFPRSEVNRALHPYNFVSAIATTATEIEVHVAEMLDDLHEGTVVHRLNRDFSPRGKVELSDLFSGTGCGWRTRWRRRRPCSATDARSFGYNLDWMKARFLFVAAAFVASVSHGQESSAALSNPYSSDADVAAGSKIFLAQCASCHGQDGRGGAAGPDLSTGRFKRASSDEGLFQIINRGIPGTTMPGSPFNAGQVWRLVAYVRSLSGARRLQVTGADAARGEALFAQHRCGGCHSSQGGAPDLAAVAPNRSLSELKQSILEPSADVHSAFWRATVTPKAAGAAAAVTGVRLNEDTFTVQLRERGTGRLRSFDKAAIASMTLDRTSPMPSYQGKLTEAGITDLVAFLIAKSQGGSSK